ncbi:ParA family protein [Planobispora rosea]|nr:ParA family protein [Planobispora rosea]
MLKGGIRKSTTAMMTAFDLAEKGEDVLVVDADHGTQGVTHWATLVYANGDELPFHVVQWSPRMGLLVPFIQLHQRETGAGRIIVDIGGEAPEVLRQAVLVADHVIAPVGAEKYELSRLAATDSIVKPTGVPMTVLLTRVPKAGVGRAKEAREEVEEAGYRVSAVEIEQNREIYADVVGQLPKTTGAYSQLVDELRALEAAR